MIVESTILPIKAGREEAFEAALKEALPLIQASKGFHKIEVRPCVEQEGSYLLLVWWDTVEDHTVGFRGSEQYQKWRAASHHFYDAPLTVLHYGDPV
ncbi:MAG TPA: antibiotic biosynthesis monooxygenase [Micropepsaceae bacterium]|nr:antibiotic biosynthesis monooxygenase [Micropepsaceae bacterium]